MRENPASRAPNCSGTGNIGRRFLSVRPEVKPRDGVERRSTAVVLVTRFIKDYAARNKDIIDMGIRKGFLTKEQAINDLGMKNEYR